MPTRSGFSGRKALRLGQVAAVVLASPLVAPQLLAFPHRATIAGHEVYSERPISPSVVRLVAEADALMRRDALGSSRPLDQSIFLTEGGWRWHWLAVSSRRSFAVSRPLGEPVIVNRADAEKDRMAGGTRRLSHVLAHELAHGAVRARFGIIRTLGMPAELVEGYADHVAGSSTLSDQQALALRKSGQHHPGLVYLSGRKKVERTLRANGGDVTRLFEDWR